MICEINAGNTLRRIWKGYEKGKSNVIEVVLIFFRYLSNDVGSKFTVCRLPPLLWNQTGNELIHFWLAFLGKRRPFLQFWKGGSISCLNFSYRSHASAYSWERRSASVLRELWIWFHTFLRLEGQPKIGAGWNFRHPTGLVEGKLNRNVDTCMPVMVGGYGECISLLI